MLSVLILTLLLSSCQGENRPIVNTSLGKVLGNHKRSYGSRIFSSFEGIPYAKPPTGERRFEEPEPVEKWNDTLDASSLYECPQAAPLTLETKISGVEDCLYINVYVPREYPSPTDNLDVIVHIHGGGFMFGSGHGYAHPGYLMDHDVIFVTFNYRLSILGFLSTEDEVLPGNNGMKDQTLALKWVRANIASFGGNPKSVTINGASAGGASVHLHYFSPLSKRLFHKGFSQSGCALNPWATKEKSLEKAKLLGTALQCPVESSTELVNCLKEKDYKDILSKINLFYDFNWYPVSAFGPVVEKDSPGAFLSEKPYAKLIKGEVEDVPWIVSFVPHEGGSLVPDFSRHPSKLNSKWEDLAAILLYYNNRLPKNEWAKAAHNIKNFYLGTSTNFSDDESVKFVKMTTDRMILEGIARSVQLQAVKTNSSVYLYELSYTGDYKNTVEHADDNQYFFSDQYERKPTKNELRMKDVMVKMFISYAKTGQPTIDGIKWKKVEAHQLSFLNISGFRTEDIRLENSNDLGNVDFWRSIGFVENGDLFTNSNTKDEL